MGPPSLFALYNGFSWLIRVLVKRRHRRLKPCLLRDHNNIALNRPDILFESELDTMVTLNYESITHTQTSYLFDLLEPNQ